MRPMGSDWGRWGTVAVLVAAEDADSVAAALAEAGETVVRIGTVDAGDKGCTVKGSTGTWSARADWSATHLG